MKPELKEKILSSLKLRQNPEKFLLAFIADLKAEAEKKITAFSESSRATLATEIGIIEKKLAKALEQGFESRFSDFLTLIEELRGIDGKDADSEVIIVSLLTNPEFISKTKGKDAEAVTDEKLLSLIKPLIPAPIPGETGESPSDQKLLSLIKPLIPKVKNGKTPTTEELISLIQQVLPEAAEAESESAEDIAKTLNKEKEILKTSTIKGLDADLRAIRREIASKKKDKHGGGAHGGGDIVNIVDLSSLTDGATLSFPVPKHRKSIMVLGSDFPSVLFENNGFTVNGARTIITLTVINAPSQGSQLGFQYVV